MVFLDIVQVMDSCSLHFSYSDIVDRVNKDIYDGPIT
jgi:hypothetical protein